MPMLQIAGSIFAETFWDIEESGRFSNLRQGRIVESVRAAERLISRFSEAGRHHSGGGN